MEKFFAFLSGAGLLTLVVGFAVGLVQDSPLIAFAILGWSAVNLVFFAVMMDTYRQALGVAGMVLGFAGIVAVTFFMRRSGFEEGLHDLATLMIVGAFTTGPSLGLALLAFSKRKEEAQPAA